MKAQIAAAMTAVVGLCGCAVGNLGSSSIDPEPTDLSGLRASWYGIGSAVVGDRIEDVEYKLGLEFAPVHWRYGNSTRCGTTVDSSERIGLVIAGGEDTSPDGTVDSFVVATSQIPFVFDGGSITIGEPLEKVQAAFYSSSENTGMPTASGGDQVRVEPFELRPGNPPLDPDNVGRSAKFDADLDGVIRQFEVGAYRTVRDSFFCSY